MQALYDAGADETEEADCRDEGEDDLQRERSTEQSGHSADEGATGEHRQEEVETEQLESPEND